jgi:hypothetical protein
VLQDEAAEDAKRAKVSSNLGIVVRKPLNREDIISRDFNAELKARVGTKTLVSPDNPNAAGFFCKETGKTLRDSISYLDHINGKRRAWLLPHLLPVSLLHAPPALRAQSNGRWG